MADTKLRVRVQKDKAARADLHKEKLLGALEKLRDAVRCGMKGGNQTRLLHTLDQIQERCLTGQLDMDTFMSSDAESRGQTRRSLRDNPSGMVQILNNIDGVEQELVEFVTFLGDAIEK